MVIAERILTSANDPAIRVIVRLSPPAPNREGGEYRCHYEILGPGTEIRHFAAGMDAFQALWLSFGMIEADLLWLQKKTGHPLLFEGDNAWFAFPLQDSGPR